MSQHDQQPPGLSRITEPGRNDYRQRTRSGSNYGDWRGHPQQRMDGPELDPDEAGVASGGAEQHSREHEPFDPDYQRWRSERMRARDEDYRIWRQEGYGKTSEAYSRWREGRNETDTAALKAETGAFTKEVPPGGLNEGPRK